VSPEANALQMRQERKEFKMVLLDHGDRKDRQQ
jgi:hypothetical protein